MVVDHLGPWSPVRQGYFGIRWPHHGHPSGRL